MTELLQVEHRQGDSRFIERIWRSRSDRAGDFLSMAACHWGMVVTRLEGKTFVTVRGPETRATIAQCPADGEWVAIHFRLGTLMPLFPASRLRDRNDVTLPDASARSFYLHGSAWEYPGYENAEVFVDRLVKRGLVVVDSCVQAALDSGSAESLSQRTEQRRFLRATGMTRGTIRQIERARRATALLQEGIPIAQVAYEAGYFDQAHLTRSLGRFIGQTPAGIAGGGQQLSFLCKTGES